MSSNIIRLTPDRLRRCKTLIKKQCCNYCDGECLLLDCPCPQMITYSLICKWFKYSVLPNNEELNIQLIKPKNTKHCKICGKNFVYKSNKAMYCVYCKKAVFSRQATLRKRKQRELSRNRDRKSPL